MTILISDVQEIIKVVGENSKILNENNFQKIQQFKSIDVADIGDMTFCVHSNSNGIEMINQSNATIILCPQDISLDKIHSTSLLILVKNPRLSFIKCMDKFVIKKKISGIDENSIIHTNNIGKNVSIGPYCYIEKDVVIGDNCVVFSGVQIYDGTKIGKNVKIYPSVVIGDANFGPQRDESMILETSEHLGGIIIGKNVEIGSNTSILPGMLDDTVIDDGTKISSQVYIGSGMKIGKNCNITGQTFFGGMSILEDNVYVAPGSTVRNKVRIGKNAFVGMGSVVVKDIPKDSTVIGIPAKQINHNSDNNAINNVL